MWAEPYVVAAKAAGVEQCFVHFIADGRDTPPSSATTYLQQVLDFTKELQYGTVATVMGRFYAMVSLLVSLCSDTLRLDRIVRIVIRDGIASRKLSGVYSVGKATSSQLARQYPPLKSATKQARPMSSSSRYVHYWSGSLFMRLLRG